MRIVVVLPWSDGSLPATEEAHRRGLATAAASPGTEVDFVRIEQASILGEPFSGRNGRHLLLEQWLKLSDTIGRRVMYGFDVMTAPQYQADVLGLDATGGLILALDDGFVKTELSGEVRYLR